MNAMNPFIINLKTIKLFSFIIAVTLAKFGTWVCRRNTFASAEASFLSATFTFNENVLSPV